MKTNKLIVIFGASGSGKTTLATEIQKYFGVNNAVIISQDDYYYGVDKMDIKNFDEPVSLDFKLLEDNLIKLLNNKPIQNPIYNFKTHTREKQSKTMQPKKLIILDGTMVMTSDVIRKLSSFSIYYDIDLDICFIRRLTRDIKERGRDAQSVVSQYLEDVRPAFFKYINKYKKDADFKYTEKNQDVLFKKLKEI